MAETYDTEFKLKSEKRRSLASRSTMNAFTSRLPKYIITRDTHQSLKSAIDDNKMLNNFLLKSDAEISQAFKDLQDKINNSITRAGLDFNYCITGSRTWYETFESVFPNLSEYEQSSIYKYNTCDSIYLIETNSIKTLDRQIHDYITEFVEYLKVILQNNGKYFSIELKPINRTKYLFRNATGYNIDLKLSDTPIVDSVVSAVPMKKTPAKAPAAKAPAARATSKSVKTTQQDKKKAQEEAEKKAKEALERKKEADRAARSARLSARRSMTGQSGQSGGTGSQSQEEEKFYRIFTFEFNLCDNSEQKKLLHNFNNLIIPTTHYLNIYGLYIFNYIGKIRYFIKRGVYNRFKVRDDIFTKLIFTSTETKIKALSDICKIYELTFKDVKLPNQHTYNILSKQLYLSHPDIQEFANTVETKIIECLRPYINQTIININNDLKELEFKDNFGKPKKGKELTGIFVAGGDAIRRYNYTASVTKDIDTKIYLSTEIPLEKFDNKKILDDCIINNLLVLLIFLIRNKHEIFRNINNSRNLKITSEKGIDVEFTLISSDENILDFKLRKLFKNPFPVDLYSLDYNAKIMFENNIQKQYDYEIAFLDIAFEQLAENYYKKYAVISNGLPISRMKFLLDDLKKTYNSDLLSVLRFQGGKIVKDFHRYEELYKIYVKSEQLTQETSYYIRKEIDIETGKYKVNGEYLINFIDPQQQRLNLELDQAIFIDKTPILRDEFYDIFKTEYDSRNRTNKEKVLFDYQLPKTMQGGAFQYINPKVMDLYNKYINYNDYRQITDKEADNIQSYLDNIIVAKKPIDPHKLIHFKNFIQRFKVV